MTVENVVISAFTEDQAESLTGISKRQLRYWDRNGFFAPSLAFDDRRAPFSRLYSFRDLVSLKVLNALRNDANVSLQHLKEVKGKLAHLGEDLWAKTVLYVLSRRVIFHNPHGDVREEVVTGQAILEIPLQVVTSGVEEAVRAMRQRDSNSVGRIENQKGKARNAPIIAGTRISVRSVKAFADAGYSVEEIRLEYPTLTSEDIKAAIEYGKAA